nr:glycosyltransferase family 2 protein [uncultured Shimia sp.]
MSINGEKTLMISVMRNEGPYVLEWLAHHFALGIDDLLIFSNDCSDNTDRILDRLEVMMPHKVKHQPNPKVMFPDRGKWHIMALRYAGQFGRCQAADWLYVTDADEFLNLKRGISDLDGFFEATGPADAVSFTSIAFNSNGHTKMSPDLVTRRFTQTATDLAAAKKENRTVLTAVKTLYRNTIQGPRRPHRPVTPDFSTTGMTWIDGAGGRLPAGFTDSGSKGIASNGTRTYAQVNHYSIKSKEEFLLKVDRGDAVNAERLGQSKRYWDTANRIGNTDKTGSKLSPKATALLDEFLADSQLRELHEESYSLRETMLQDVLSSKRGEAVAQQIGYFD